MTVKAGVRRIIIKKTIVLISIAAILGYFCYFSSSHKGLPAYNNAHLIYTLASIGLSLIIFLYIAWKMRYFHNLFSKEFTGSIVDLRREIIRSYRANLAMDDVVMIIKLDGTDKHKKLRLPGNKVGRIYCVGDRVHRIKGTRYPINLTREVEQHICPICGFNSCYGDECPNCKVKY